MVVAHWDLCPLNRLKNKIKSKEGVPNRHTLSVYKQIDLNSLLELEVQTNAYYVVLTSVVASCAISVSELVVVIE